MEYLIGAGLALTARLFAMLSGFDRDRVSYSSLLVIAIYSRLIAVIRSPTPALAIESAVASTFLVLAVGSRKSLGLVAAPLAAHAVRRPLFVSVMILWSAAAFAQSGSPEIPSPADVKPGSITCEECPYPYPSSYFPLTLYGQDVRMAYMDVAPGRQPNGHTVVLLHGNNFAGFYFGAVIDALRNEGFRVIVPDQIGYGRSSKPIIPYYLVDMARNTRALLQSLNISKAMIVGHSMGGMLAARFATQYPDVTERLVLFNPIGLTDARFNNPSGDPEEAYRRVLASTYQTIRASLMRYVAHKPEAWNSQFESYVRIRYAWTLSADWPRLARVQALISNLINLDPVVYDWPHIQAPTLIYGGAEDMLPGTATAFQEGMKRIATAIPNGKARLQLLPGLGHVPFIEDPQRSLPPLVAFLKEGA
jgi:pimeloyl-ACP methyl ester carboxylesterase